MREYKLGAARPPHFDHQEIKRRLAFVDLMANEGINLRRSGPNYVGRCPFHEERSASFTVHGPAHDHGHCYGCGWHGDVFDFWMARHGGAFVDAVRALASLAAVSPSVFEAKRKQIERASPGQIDGNDARGGARQKPTLPRMRALTEGEMEQLGSLRSLSVEGIRAAAMEKRVGYCEWPQYLDQNGAWARAKEIQPCWVVTDRSRWVAQFRRLDGGLFKVEDREIKCWTKGSPTWPLGTADLRQKQCALLVEGGADMLGAYHFLHLFGQLHRVAVLAMLGASCSICDEALSFFARKRVRIMMQEDEPKARPGKPDAAPIYPGREAAARWTAQLTEAGCAVETFSLADLLKRDGSKVKDVNDLALMDEAAWLDGELRQAFVDFDF